MARRLEFFDMSGDGDGTAPYLHEPTSVPTVHVDGVKATAEGPNVRCVFWDQVSPTESRIVDRLSMTRGVAHGLMTQLQAIFSGEH